LALFLGARLKAQDQPLTVVKIQIDLKTTISRFSPDFVGVGYETSAFGRSSNRLFVAPGASLGRAGLAIVGEQENKGFQFRIMHTGDAAWRLRL
jgi:hypothetical protein